MQCDRFVELCLERCLELSEDFFEDPSDQCDLAFLVGAALGIIDCSLRHGFSKDQVRIILNQHLFSND